MQPAYFQKHPVFNMLKLYILFGASMTDTAAQYLMAVSRCMNLAEESILSTSAGH